MSGLPQGSVLGTVLFNIIVGDVDAWIECTLSKFADDAKLCGAVDTLEERGAIQGGLDKLERWACENIMKFNKAKCKVPHTGRGSINHKCRLGKGIKSSPEEKDLGVLVNQKLSMTRQCVLAAQKTNHTLSYIPSSMGSRTREGILPLCSALVRHHQEPCVQLWNPQHRKDMEPLEQGQRRATKMF